MIETLITPHFWIALISLTLLEIVLGIDNIIFISIVTDRLAEPKRTHARRLGLLAASLTRIGLLLFLVWIQHLTKPWFVLWGFAITGQSLVLVGGGLFLIAKSSMEIHAQMEIPDSDIKANPTRAFFLIILQIMVLDIVFSLDSIITAIGLVKEIPVMICAILIAIGFMIFLSSSISKILRRHPSIKMLALSFLLMIGLLLILEGFGLDVPKGYAYSAMAFSVFVETLNIFARRNAKKKRLHYHDA